MNNHTYTVIVPVYGRSELLGQCLDSVARLKTENYELMIADDGSDFKTREYLSSWIRRNHKIAVSWKKRARNHGLFANLNMAINEAAHENILLLCSDDTIMPHALEQLDSIASMCPDVELILSTFKSINEDGSARYDDSAWHHDQISRVSCLLERDHFNESLLRFGSVNGNLSGMAFKKELWRKAGPFKEDWKHAADWEWLVRVSFVGNVFLNRTPISSVRTHDKQLSNKNRIDGHEVKEVSAVVKMLIDRGSGLHKRRWRAWGAHVMQFQLWNTLKHARPGTLRRTFQYFGYINESVGLWETFVALIRWLPQRIGKRLSGRLVESRRI